MDAEAWDLDITNRAAAGQLPLSQVDCLKRGLDVNARSTQTFGASSIAGTILIEIEFRRI